MTPTMEIDKAIEIIAGCDDKVRTAILEIIGFEGWPINEASKEIKEALRETRNIGTNAESEGGSFTRD